MSTHLVLDQEISQTAADYCVIASDEQSACKLNMHVQPFKRPFLHACVPGLMQGGFLEGYSWFQLPSAAALRAVVAIVNIPMGCMEGI